MKKLLLILICLFVSFEVKSKEVVLKCTITKKTEGSELTKEREIEYLNKFPKILYFDVKNKWLFDRKRDDFFEYNKESIDRGEIKFTFEESNEDYFFQTKTEIPYRHTTNVRLDRYDGYLFFRTVMSFEDDPKMYIETLYGKCEKVKKKLF